MTTRGARYWKSGSIPLIGPDILGDIIATLSDLAVVVSPEGEVLSVLANPVHGAFGDLHRWEGLDLRSVLTPESVPKFDAALAAHLESPSAARPVELNHRERDGPQRRWEFPISYTLHRIGPDHAVLMLGRDLRPVAEMQQQLVQAQIALEKDYEAQRESDARFHVLLGHVGEAMVFVSVSTGQILDLNEAAAALLGRPREALAGRSFAGEVAGRERAELMADLVTDAARAGPAGAGGAAPAGGGVALSLARSHRAVRAHPVLFRSASEQVVLCRLVPEGAAAAEAGGAAGERAQDLAELFELGADAIVTTDEAGVVRLANDAFLHLVGGTDLSAVLGRPLSDFLVRGVVDLRVLLNGAGAAGRVRHYATRLLGAYGGQRPVTLSVTQLSGGPRPGYGFVMREPGPAATAGPGPGAALQAAAARPVDELVGTIPMKDIVAQTADVVERMCIEAAIAMTANNRVAAATILGLSRQSLYVKLRKFGLIGPDSEGSGRELST